MRIRYITQAVILLPDIVSYLEGRFPRLVYGVSPRIGTRESLHIRRRYALLRLSNRFRSVLSLGGKPGFQAVSASLSPAYFGLALQ